MIYARINPALPRAAIRPLASVSGAGVALTIAFLELAGLFRITKAAAVPLAPSLPVSSTPSASVPASIGPATGARPVVLVAGTSDPAPAPGTAAATVPQGPLSLLSAVSTSIAYNASMTQASARLRASEARLSEELALRSPQYGLTTTLTGNDASGYHPFSTLNSVLSIPLDTAGRTGDLVRQARADLASSWWTYRRSQSDLSFQVATAYYGLLKAQEEKTIAEDAAAQARAQQTAAQKRFDAGDVPRTDVLRAEVQSAQAGSDLLRAANAVRLGTSTLDNELGVSLGGRSLTPADTLAEMPASLEAVETALAASSPETAIARAALESARAAQLLTRTEGRPQISIQGSYTRTGDPTTYPQAVGAGVSIVTPLPDGGGRRSRERQAEAAVSQAQASVVQAVRQARLNLENAYLSAQDARQRVDITGEAVRLAAESLRAATLGYENGVSSSRDVIDAQVALELSRTQQAEAAFDYNLSVARIYNVLGDAPPGVTLTPVPLWAVRIADLKDTSPAAASR